MLLQGYGGIQLHGMGSAECWAKKFEIQLYILLQAFLSGKETVVLSNCTLTHLKAQHSEN